MATAHVLSRRGFELPAVVLHRDGFFHECTGGRLGGSSQCHIWRHHAICDAGPGGTGSLTRIKCHFDGSRIRHATVELPMATEWNKLDWRHQHESRADKCSIYQ